VFAVFKTVCKKGDSISEL